MNEAINKEQVNDAEGPLTERQRVYLYTIYQLHRTGNQILSADIARRLNVSKPSVLFMLENLEKRQLVTKKHYGRVIMTEKGVLVGEELDKCMQHLIRVIPKMGIKVQPQEAKTCAWELFRSLPDFMLNKIVAAQ